MEMIKKSGLLHEGVVGIKVQRLRVGLLERPALLELGEALVCWCMFGKVTSLIAHHLRKISRSVPES